MWVIVISEEEKWIKKVLTKCYDQLCVRRCLEKLFGIHQPQLSEREREKISFISARPSTLISHQSKHKLMQMVEKDTNGSDTTNWLLFALVFLLYFFFSLFLKLVISPLLKNLKSLSWSFCDFNSPDYQVSESCTPTYTYICYTYQNY